MYVFLFSVPLVVDILIPKYKLLNCMLHLGSPVAEEGLVGVAGWDFMGMGKDRVLLAGIRKD